MHLAQHHDIWVMSHAHDRANVESFIANWDGPRPRFIWVRLPKALDTWRDHSASKGIRLHYVLWQREVLRQAIALHNSVGFDLTHHVSWGTISLPPLLWKLPVPFVWGPVGGAQTCPWAFRGYFGTAWPSEVVRTARVHLACLSPSVRKSAQGCALALATNQETASALLKAGASHVRTFLDSGLTADFLPQASVSRPVKPELTLLWVGGLVPLKALPIALEAIARTRDVPLRLIVAGDGPLMKKWRAEARTLGVDRQVVFLGRVPWKQMPELYREADAFIFTSLRDSFGTQVLEAMAHALPVLTLNHQGVGTFVPDDAGIKVPVKSPRETVEDVARGIRLLAASPEIRAEMGRKGWEFARTQTWERRARKMSSWYQEIIDSRQPAESHLEQECHAG